METNFKDPVVVSKHLTDIAKRCKTDTAFRQSLEKDGWNLLREINVADNFPNKNVKVEVKYNNDNDYYFILPQNPNIDLTDEMLASVNAAKASSVSSVSSVGTASSAFSCVSTASTAGSAGSTKG